MSEGRNRELKGYKRIFKVDKKREGFVAGGFGYFGGIAVWARADIANKVHVIPCQNKGDSMQMCGVQVDNVKFFLCYSTPNQNS